MNPESDPLGTGYHLSQSKIAIGSGGPFGKGFLNGTQSHLQYLPETHTDFIFATMTEEWGLVGGIVVLLAYGYLIKWAMGRGFEATSTFARLTATGLAFTLFLYVSINMAMVMGLAPVVGIPTATAVLWGLGDDDGSDFARDPNVHSSRRRSCRP